MNEKKPRTISIGIDFSRIGAFRGLTISPNGAISVAGSSRPIEELDGEVGVGYRRPKGLKVTVRLFGCPGGLATPAAAIPRFTRVFAMDTNVRELGGERVAFFTAAELRNYSFVSDHWSGTIQPLWCVEFHGIAVDAERYGWHCGLVMLSAAGLLETAPTLLVVDAHLGHLQQLARRELPVWDRYLLPDGMHLAYASSDTQNDSPLNRMVHVCDAVSTERYRTTARDPNPPPLERAPPGAPYHSLRYWAIDPALPH